MESRTSLTRNKRERKSIREKIRERGIEKRERGIENKREKIINILKE